MTALLAALLAISAPDATLLRPERVLAPAEVVLDLGFGNSYSGSTRAPTGGPSLADPFATHGLRLRGTVGVLRYLGATLVLPLVEHSNWSATGLGVTRFGDPQVGLIAGGKLGEHGAAQHWTLAVTGDIGFATSNKNVLYPVSGDLQRSARGATITTGAASLTPGGYIGYARELPRLSFIASARGFYRARFGDASHGAGFDLRLQLVTFEHLLLGLRVDGLFALYGGDRALISPSRLSDGASYIDVTLSAGTRIKQGIDVSVAVSAPVYSASTGQPLGVHLLASFVVGK